MNSTTGNTETGAARVRFQRVRAAREIADLAQDVVDGMLEAPRSLPPKYFYDETGSQLFDEICRTPEYYPTRTEEQLLAEYAGRILAVTHPDFILEFGSGSSRKTHHLLREAGSQTADPAYWPFDICESMIRQTGNDLVDAYPWLTVHGLVGDYMAGLQHLPQPQGDCLYVFLGGTIGNFEHRAAVKFLSEIREQMGAGDALLLGADRVKAPQLLHAAYNDAQGLTAAFNLNVLRVLNRELNADFDPGGFTHEAQYNSDEQQIEMYLVSDRRQTVEFARLERSICIDRGERILTEISRKFTRESLESLLRQAGLCTEYHFEPENGYFSLVLARPLEA